MKCSKRKGGWFCKVTGIRCTKKDGCKAYEEREKRRKENMLVTTA